MSKVDNCINSLIEETATLKAEVAALASANKALQDDYDANVALVARLKIEVDDLIDKYKLAVGECQALVAERDAYKATIRLSSSSKADAGLRADLRLMEAEKLEALIERDSIQRAGKVLEGLLSELRTQRDELEKALRAILRWVQDGPGVPAAHKALAKVQGGGE